MYDAIKKHINTVDILINNAIISKGSKFLLNKKNTDWENEIAVNINGNIVLTQKIANDMKTRKVKYVEKFLNELFTQRNEFAVNYLSKVFLEFKMDFSPLPVIASNKAAKINTPISIFAADDDLMFPGKKMIKRASKIFPSLKEIKLIQNSKHVLDNEQNIKIEKYILDAE